MLGSPKTDSCGKVAKTFVETKDGKGLLSHSLQGFLLAPSRIWCLPCINLTSKRSNEISMRVGRLYLVEHSAIRECWSFLCAPQLPYSRSVSLAASLSLHGVAYFFLNSHLLSLARARPIWSLERDKGAHPLPTPLRVLHFPLTAALTGLKPKLNDFRRNSLLYGLKLTLGSAWPSEQ